MQGLLPPVVVLGCWDVGSLVLVCVSLQVVIVMD